MGLVKGFTDILTPINLVPNSNFSRGGGYPSTITGSNLTSTTNVFLPIGYGIRLSQTYASSIDSYTVTRATNSLNFNVNTTRGLRVHFSGAKATLPSNTTYTLVAEFSTTTPIEYFYSRLLLLDNGNGRTYDYYSGPQNLGNNRYRVVCITRSDANANVYLNFDGGESGSTTSVNINLTVHYIAAYKGSFVNPPTDISSLDVDPSSQFIKEFDHGAQNYRLMKADNQNHWYRLAKLEGQGTGTALANNSSTMASWKGIICRPWLHADHMVICHITCDVMYSNNTSTNINYQAYSIQGTRTVTRNTTMLSSFRLAIARDPIYDTNAKQVSIYLEVYMEKSGSSAGNPIIVIPEVGFCSDTNGLFSGKMISNICQGSYDIIGDNDTIIGETYTPENITKTFTWPNPLP